MVYLIYLYVLNKRSVSTTVYRKSDPADGWAYRDQQVSFGWSSLLCYFFTKLSLMNIKNAIPYHTIPYHTIPH